MAKPWAKLEIGYLDHPKFQALNANAIALWHEGKQYCDRFNTDGLIPSAVAKRFRFGGKKSISMLTTAIDFPKPDGGRYAPLWDTHTVGFKMHDYLDHNDCRDEVLARMEDAADHAELRKAANTARQAEFRAKRKAKLAVLRVTGSVTDVTRDSHGDSDVTVTVTNNAPTVTATETATATPKEKRSASDDARPHPVKEFLTLYERCFFDLTGERPVFANGRDAKIAKTALDKLGADKAHGLLRAFFASDDAFIAKSGYGLNIFAGQINKLLADMHPRAMPVAAGGRTGAPPKGKYDGIEEG